MLRTYTHIGIRVAVIMGVLVFCAYAFVVQGEFVGDTFATNSGQGGLEMQIDSRTVYNGVIQPKLTWALKNLVPGVDHFFDFDDVKPGDNGTNTISIHIKKSPAWVCLDFINLVDEENGVNEPESEVDLIDGGELSKELEFFSWLDDGDNIFEVGEKPLFGTSTQSGYDVLREKTYAIADYTTGTPIPKNATQHVGIVWCAGDLSVNTATAQISCNGILMGNETQTDSMKIDVKLRAVSATEQKTFTCIRPEVRVCESKVNLVQNGSFETPMVGSAKWDVFPSQQNGLEWTVAWITPTNISPAIPLLELQRGRPADDGTQFAELDSDFYGPPGGNYHGEKTSVRISQILNTVPGNTYKLSFAFSPLPGKGSADNAVSVRIGGVSQGAPITASGIGKFSTVWNTYTYFFVATSTQTEISLADAGVTNSFGTLVDDVSFSCVDEKEMQTPWHSLKNKNDAQASSESRWKGLMRKFISRV